MVAVAIDAGMVAATAAATPATITVNFATSTGTPGVGDYIIIAIGIRGASGTITTPTGWTLISSNTHPTSATNRIVLYGRIRQAGDAGSQAFTITGGTTNETILGHSFYFGGIDPVNPVEVSPVWTNSSATSATLAGPLTGATSLGANALAVAFWHRADDAGTFTTASSGWTHFGITNAVASSALGTDAAMGIGYKRIASPAASGTYQLDVATGTAVHWTGCVLILKGQEGNGTVATVGNGTDEATPVAQSTAEPAISIIVGSGTTKYDTAQFMRGGSSLRHTVAAQQQRFKLNADIPDNIHYSRFYFRMSAFPSSTQRIHSMEGYDGTDWLQLQISSTGVPRLANSGASITSSPVISACAINAWHRFECYYNGPAGTGELKVYSGADLQTLTVTQTTSITGIANGTVGRGMFGPGQAFFTADLWYDDSAIQRHSWIGPAKDLRPVPRVGNITVKHAAMW